MVRGQMAGQRAQSGIKCRMHCLVSNVTLTTGLIRGKLGVHYGHTRGIMPYTTWYSLSSFALHSIEGSKTALRSARVCCAQAVHTGNRHCLQNRYC